MRNVLTRLFLALSVAAGILLTATVAILAVYNLAGGHAVYPLALAVLALVAVLTLGAFLALALAVELDPPDGRGEDDLYCPHGVEWDYCPVCCH